MPTRDEFISAILARPEDDALRLVYADWLDEQGEGVPAAFVRVQCERARLDKRDPRAKELDDEEYRLRQEGDEQTYPKTYATLLLAHLYDLGFTVGGYFFDFNVDFNRGLIEGLEVYDGERGAGRFIEKAQEILSHDPITRLKFVPASPHSAQYSFTPDLEYRLTDSISTTTLDRLLAVDRVRQLRELDLVGNSLDDTAIGLLVSSPNLTDLRTLRVGPGEHSDGTAYQDIFLLPAQISADGRSRLRVRFAERVAFSDE